MEKTVIIACRESRLSLIQSEIAADSIRRLHPEISVRIVGRKTTGDLILDKPLENIGGKGLFVKELDASLAEGKCDICIHSLKDVPMIISDEFSLVAFSSREDPRDALVLPEGCDEIDFSKPIGCSSRRRMLQFKTLYPQAVFETIRGNVQTRLKKLDEGQYSATLLAVSGLKRLGLEHRVSRYFSTDEMIPAAGQGILAAQGLSRGSYEYLDGFNDEGAAACALAERAFVRGLGGDCATPIGAFAEIEGDSLLLKAVYCDRETGNIRRGELRGRRSEPEAAGSDLARRFLAT